MGHDVEPLMKGQLGVFKQLEHGSSLLEVLDFVCNVGSEVALINSAQAAN